jgi:hypothetical protein
VNSAKFLLYHAKQARISGTISSAIIDDICVAATKLGILWNLSGDEMMLAKNRIPWRERPTQSVPAASEIGGWSPSHTYNLIAQNKLKAVRVANKTAVVTQSLIELLDAAEPWTPNTERVEAANRARLNPRKQISRPPHTFADVSFALGRQVGPRHRRRDRIS